MARGASCPKANDMCDVRNQKTRVVCEIKDEAPHQTCVWREVCALSLRSHTPDPVDACEVCRVRNQKTCVVCEIKDETPPNLCLWREVCVVSVRNQTPEPAPSQAGSRAKPSATASMRSVLCELKRHVSGTRM